MSAFTLRRKIKRFLTSTQKPLTLFSSRGGLPHVTRRGTGSGCGQGLGISIKVLFEGARPHLFLGLLTCNVLRSSAFALLKRDLLHWHLTQIFLKVIASVYSIQCVR